MNLHTSDSENDFYRDAVGALQKARVPFLIGGAYALRYHTGVVRDTKDFDIYVREGDVERALEVCRAAGYDGARNVGAIKTPGRTVAAA